MTQRGPVRHNAVVLSIVSGWVLNTAETKAETKSYAVNLQEMSDPIGFFVMASVVAARNARSFCPSVVAARNARSFCPV